MAMIFRFVRSVVFDIFWPLNMACKSCVFPLPMILVLRDTQVYIYAFNSGNITFYIKVPID